MYTVGTPDLYNIMSQCQEDSEVWFGKPSDLTVLCFGLVGEAGEFIDAIKKVLRGSHKLEDVYPKAAEELTDLFIYVCTTAATLSIDLPQEYAKKRAINVERFGNGHSVAGQSELQG